jgi:hypothetical protein
VTGLKEVDPVLLAKAARSIRTFRGYRKLGVFQFAKYFPVLFQAGVLIDRSDSPKYRKKFRHVAPFRSRLESGRWANTISLLVEDTRIKSGNRLFRVYGGQCCILVVAWDPAETPETMLYSQWDVAHAGLSINWGSRYGFGLCTDTLEGIRKYNCGYYGYSPAFVKERLLDLRPLFPPGVRMQSQPTPRHVDAEELGKLLSR